MRPRALGQLLFLAAVLPQLVAQEPSFRLVPRPGAEPARPFDPPWFATLGEAEAAAKQRQTNVLLFFTAKGCAACKQVEDETFFQPEVQKQLAGLALARLDVDEPANVEACRRYRGQDGVPTFVLLTPTGGELHRWAGALATAEFLVHLRRGLPDAVRASTGPRDHQAALVEFHLRQNDQAKVAEHLDALEKLDPARISEALEGALWACCTAARQRRDWPALLAAAQRYLALPSPLHVEEVQLLLGIAEFETSGTVRAELQEYIAARVATLSTPCPGTTIADRVQRVLGAVAGGAQGDAARDWVRASNAAMRDLTDVGRAAAPSLRAALLGSQAGSRHAASVLASMHLPETTPWLIDRLGDASTPAWARPHLVSCIGMHEEERCLPTLLACLTDANPPAVRAEAAYGIKRIGWKTDGTSRQDIADAMAAALDANDLRLLGEVLQALFGVHAPIPLEPLLDLLSDRRPLGWGDDYRVCDNALWILMRQLGLWLEHADGTRVDGHCTPAIAAFMRRWYAEARGRLRWDPVVKHYRDTAK